MPAAKQPVATTAQKSGAKPRLKIVVLTLALIACSPVVWHRLTHKPDGSKAQAAAESTLLHLGYDWATISVQNGQAIISGEAPSEGVRAVAYQRVRTAITALTGFGTVRDFQDKMTVSAAPPTRYEVASSSQTVSDAQPDATADVVGVTAHTIETSAVNPPAKTSREDCQTEFADLMSKSKIAFGVDSAKIEASSLPLVDQLVSIAKRCASYKLIVEGHTDLTGRVAHNRDLSQRRADAVREALVKHGVTKKAITSIGFGASRPIAKGENEAAYAKNRRIEFKVGALAEQPKLAGKK